MYEIFLASNGNLFIIEQGTINVAIEIISRDFSLAERITDFLNKEQLNEV